MAWTWRYEDREGTALPTQKSPSFDNQSDAESWVGESWRELLSGGVDQVTLLEGDAVVYEAMSLHPPE